MPSGDLLEIGHEPEAQPYIPREILGSVASGSFAEVTDGTDPEPDEEGGQDDDPGWNEDWPDEPMPLG